MRKIGLQQWCVEGHMAPHQLHHTSNESNDNTNENIWKHWLSNILVALQSLSLGILCFCLFEYIFSLPKTAKTSSLLSLPFQDNVFDLSHLAPPCVDPYHDNVAQRPPPASVESATCQQKKFENAQTTIWKICVSLFTFVLKFHFTASLLSSMLQVWIRKRKSSICLLASLLFTLMRTTFFQFHWHLRLKEWC